MTKNKLITAAALILGAFSFNSSAAIVNPNQIATAPIYGLTDFIKSNQPKEYLSAAINSYNATGTGKNDNLLKCNKVVNYDDLGENQREVKILVKCEQGVGFKNYVVAFPKKASDKFSVIIKK